MNKLNKTIFLAAALLLASICNAETKNDNTKYAGDILWSSFKLYGATLNDDKKQTVCIPSHTKLRGLGDFDEETGLTVKTSGDNMPIKSCDADPKDIPYDVAIKISAKSFKEAAFHREGITYGGLIVPFKYHPSGSKEFSGNSTAAPYFGYRWDDPHLGYSVKAIGFMGISTVSVQQNIDGESKSQSLAGFSYGAGAILSAKSDFQFGLVVGADRVSKSAKYDDNGKIWIAFAFGYSFAN